MNESYQALIETLYQARLESRRLRISQLRRMADVARSRWSDGPCTSMRQMDQWIRFEDACLTEIERLRGEG